MFTRTASLAAFVVTSGLIPSPLLAQEPVVMARHGGPAMRWTANYVYDCNDTRISFYLSVKPGQPEVTDFDFGRGSEPEIDQRINEAMANQEFSAIAVICAPDGMGSTVIFRTNRTSDDGRNIPAWVRVGATHGPEKVVVTAGVVGE